MKKYLFILVVLLIVGYGFSLIAPVGLLALHLASLEFSEDILQKSLGTLATFSVTEAIGQTVGQTVSVTITEEQLSALLYQGVTAKERSFLTIERIQTKITPETIFLTVSVKYGLFGYHPLAATVFSEWMLRLTPKSQEFGENGSIEIQPVRIYTDHFYSANFVKLRKYFENAAASDWIPLTSGLPVTIQDILLQEHEIIIDVVND